MSISDVKTSLGDFAKDIKLNLGSVLNEEGAEGLNENAIFAIALSCAYATKNETLIKAVEEDAFGILSEAEVNASRGAATIMAMNNIYYRSIHLLSDNSYEKMPAKLRMNIIANHGIDKLDFELYCLAVSAINGCGACLDSHSQSIINAGGTKQAIHSAIRIASVVNATAQELTIGK